MADRPIEVLREAAGVMQAHAAAKPLWRRGIKRWPYSPLENSYRVELDRDLVLRVFDKTGRQVVAALATTALDLLKVRD